MRNYEIMFILSTQLTDEEKQAGVKLVEDTLAKAGAVEIKTEVWGERKWVLCSYFIPNGWNRIN